MQLTLKKNVYCEYHNDITVALVLAESEDGELHVLTALDKAATELADYGAIGQVVEVEESLPPDGLADLLHRCVREYRWDWGLTPDDCDILFGKVKVLAVV